jgi:F-type H+-transporting ATPase subunit b
MDQTLKQVGELLLGAVPTVIFVMLLMFFYRVLVHQPLARVLEERHRRTAGAVAQARADIAAAEARTAEYESKLRAARSAMFRGQEERRQAALKAREAVLVEARTRAQQQVAAAKATLEQEKTAARGQLQGEVERLAAEIIRAVMQPFSSRPSPAGGGQ